jgi:hypothetical protein
MTLPENPGSPATAERLAQLNRLVYELLDAHLDTERLVYGLSTDLRWRAHLDYLRDLQRTGHEILAGGAAE